MKRDNPDAEDEDKKHFRIGSGLDCLLTDASRFSKDFIVVDAIRPFGYMGKFVECLPRDIHIGSHYDDYMDAYYKAGYKMKIETVVTKFWENEEAVNYYRNVVNVDKENKTILSKDEYDTISKCRELILSNEYITKYFIPTSIHEEVMHQLPIYFTYNLYDTEARFVNGIECKGLLDGILINHKTKVIQPFDLKTIGKSIYDFRESFTNYGYFRQASFYTYALQSSESPIKTLLDEGYSLANFIFIVVETNPKSVMPALEFRTTDLDLHCGINGGKIGNRKYKGIDELIRAYEFHCETDLWDLPKDLYDSKGVIILDVFNNDTNRMHTSTTS